MTEPGKRAPGINKEGVIPGKLNPLLVTLRSGTNVVNKIYGTPRLPEKEKTEVIEIEDNEVGKGIAVNLPKATLNSVVNGSDEDIREFKKFFNLAMLMENFSWASRAAMVIPVVVNSHSASAVIDTGCSGGGYLSRIL